LIEGTINYAGQQIKSRTVDELKEKKQSYPHSVKTKSKDLVFTTIGWKIFSQIESMTI
jgi:hypothetical protein